MIFLKTKTIQYLLITSLALLLFLIFTPTADAWWTAVVRAGTALLGGAASGISNATVSNIAPLLIFIAALEASNHLLFAAFYLVNTFIHHTIFEFANIINDSIIQELWKVFRDFINFFIIISFLVTAVINVISPRAGFRFALVGLAISAVFVNFGAIITITIIDLSHIIFGFFWGLIPGTVENIIFPMQEVERAVIENFGTGGSLEGFSVKFLSYITLLSKLICAVMLFFFSVILIKRFLFSILLVLASPVAMIGIVVSFFTKTEQDLGLLQKVITFSETWKNWLSFVFTTPIFVAVGFGLSIIISSVVAKNLTPVVLSGDIEYSVSVVASIVPIMVFTVIVFYLTLYLFKQTKETMIPGVKIRETFGNVRRVFRTIKSKRDELIKAGLPKDKKIETVPYFSDSKSKLLRTLGNNRFFALRKEKIVDKSAKQVAKERAQMRGEEFNENRFKAMNKAKEKAERDGVVFNEDEFNRNFNEGEWVEEQERIREERKIRRRALNQAVAKAKSEAKAKAKSKGEEFDESKFEFDVKKFDLNFNAYEWAEEQERIREERRVEAERRVEERRRNRGSGGSGDDSGSGGPGARRRTEGGGNRRTGGGSGGGSGGGPTLYDAYGNEIRSDSNSQEGSSRVNETPNNADTQAPQSTTTTPNQTSEQGSPSGNNLNTIRMKTDMFSDTVREVGERIDKNTQAAKQARRDAAQTRRDAEQAVKQARRDAEQAVKQARRDEGIRNEQKDDSNKENK